jgi:glycosyltransferase involved in cell wall biosynthesis
VDSPVKKIWLINPVAMPPKYETRVQTLKRAQYLREQGYDVTIISGSYLHNTDVNLIPDNKPFFHAEYDGGHKFIHIRTSSYSANGIKRIYSILEFYIRLWWYASKFGKVDYISHLAAVPFGNLTYYVARKKNARFIVDVVDLWPESFVAFGLIGKNNLLVKFAYWAEQWLYAKADLLIFSMEGGTDYIKEKKWSTLQGGKVDLEKVFYINNGVDLSDFDKNKIEHTIVDEDLSNSELFKVIYIGSIRLANNVMQLIEAAEYLKDIPDLKFLIYGDGSDRLALESYCKEKGLTNVVFKQKWVELKYVPYILSKSSLNILNYKPSPIFRFGGSQSKSFQYMASSKPICANVEMNYCPITKYKLGIARHFGSAREYADAIASFYYMDEAEYLKMCDNARFASKEYDYKLLTARFVKLLKSEFEN